jgi:PAS domain S-box-containing protein
MPEKARKLALFPRAFIPFLIVCCTLVLAPWGIAYWSIETQRDQAFETNFEQATRLNIYFQRRIRNLFNYSDNYLKSVRRAFQEQNGLQGVRSYMKAVPLDREIVSHITIVGPNGVPLSVSGHKIKPGVTAKDRAYFKFQEASKGDEIYISKPRRGRNSGKLLIRLVRRLQSADGAFAGVVFSAMEVDKFTNFFDGLRIASNSVVNLIGADKTLRARSSYVEDNVAADISGSQLWDRLKYHDVGFFEEPSVIDGLARHYVFRKLEEYPLVVTVGVSTEEISQIEGKNVVQQLSIAALLSLVIVGALLMFWRERFASGRLSSEVARQTEALRRENATRRATEYSLRESEQRFRDFTGASADWFWEMDENLKFSYFSEKFESVTGVPPSVLLGKTRQETGIPDVNPEVWRAQLDDLAMHRRFRGFEHPRELPDGRIVHLSISGMPVFGEEGDFVGYRGTGSDITAQKEAETELRRARDDLERRVLSRTQALRESEQQLRDFAGASADWFWETDVNHNFNYFSENFVRLTGLDPDKLYGKNRESISRKYPENDPKKIDAYVATQESHSIFRDFEFAYMRDDVGARWLRVSGIPVFDTDGAFVGYRGSGTDITAFRRGEQRLRDSEAKLQQAQKMEAVGQLTGGVAHDFNNLLSVIIGSLDFLNEPDVRETERKSLVTAALRAAEKGAELTHRLLAFSRKQALQPETTDVNELVSGMTDLLRRTLGESIECEFVYQSDLPTIEIDAVQLESSLVNLAVNARHSMPNGGVLRIATSLSTLDENALSGDDAPPAGPFVALFVTDTGQGMSPEVLSQVYDPFFTTKSVGEGSGLGLSMVHGFMRQSHGHVSISSVEGVGTTVRLYFPATDATPQTVLAAPSAPTPPKGDEEVILVVEDDEDLRRLAVSIISHLGYKVLVASDGPSAIEVLDNTAQIDLVFTDVVLPNGMNGSKIADYARTRHPAVKVLLTSGYNENIIVHDGALDEGVALLPKPYRRAELARRISDILKRAS